MWMTSCPEAMGWGFWVIFEKKKQQLVEIWSWTRRVQWGYGMRRAFVGSDGTVRIVKIVCLSPRVEKPKSQEGNKSFVPDLPRIVSVSGFLCIWTFYISVYFTYLGPILNILHNSSGPLSRAKVTNWLPHSIRESLNYLIWLFSLFRSCITTVLETETGLIK